jgi:hypothetical protein
MKAIISAIDGLLRGKRTSDAALRDNAHAIPARIFVPACLVLGATYGFFMAWYAIANKTPDVAVKQAVSSMIKLPALFLLTLCVTFPSLYVFNALVGCRLGLQPTMRLLISAIVVNLAVSASMGPIVGFFTLSTDSYAFMVVLNVVLLAIGGFIGLGFLFRTLRRLAAQAAEEEYDAGERERMEQPAAPSDTVPGWKPPSDREVFVQNRVGSASIIFWVWVVLYGAVGAQMGWLLRPFIGHPDAPFMIFRPRVDNFFTGVGQNIAEMLK